MHWNVLLEVPEDTEYSELEGDIQSTLRILGTTYPAGHKAPGSVTDSPTKLLHARVHSDAEDIESLLNAMIIAYGLDWLILGIQSVQAVENVYEYDEELGEDVIVGKAVISAVPCDLGILSKYLADRYEWYGVDGVGIGDPLEKQLSWIHHYQGQGEWI